MISRRWSRRVRTILFVGVAAVSVGSLSPVSVARLRRPSSLTRISRRLTPRGRRRPSRTRSRTPAAPPRVSPANRRLRTRATCFAGTAAASTEAGLRRLLTRRRRQRPRHALARRGERVPVVARGEHDDRLGSVALQSPRSAAPAGRADASHDASRSHAAAVKFPAKHVAADATYPRSHVGSHDDPLASVAVQSPKLSALAGSAEASHGSGSHVADVRVPARQDVTPFLLYPEAHVGEHVSPLRSIAVHESASAALSGATKLHGSGSHVATDVSVPAAHVVVPFTE